MSSVAPKKPLTRFLNVAVPAALVVWLLLGVLSSVPLAFNLLIRSPTPTQAALLGWGLWVLPIGALIVGALTRGGAKVMVMALLAGGVVELFWAGLAKVVFPEYPAGGPHEMLAMGVFAAVVVSSIALAAVWLRRRRVAPIAIGLTSLLVASLTILGGWAAVNYLRNPVAWELPLGAYPVRRYSHVDVMGIDIEYAQAVLTEPQLRAYVERLGLKPRPPAVETSRLSAEATFAPPWYRYRKGTAWFDPKEVKDSDERHEQWTVVHWDGHTHTASVSCGSLW